MTAATSPTVMLGLYKTGHGTKGSILAAMRRVSGE